MAKEFYYALSVGQLPRNGFVGPKHKMKSGEIHTGHKHTKRSRPLYFINTIAYDKDGKLYKKERFRVKKIYKTLGGEKLKAKAVGTKIVLYKDKKRWRGPFSVKVKYRLKRNNKKLFAKAPREKTPSMSQYYKNKLSIGINKAPKSKNKKFKVAKKTYYRYSN